MTSKRLPTPPFKILSAALRKTTEHLAREVVNPSESPPSWSDLEWTVARAVAAMQGITMLLAYRLRWRGPVSWESFLAEQRTQSAVRDLRIGALLDQIDAATQGARISCVALKGSTLRGLGLYRPGERPMSDVDLLVGRDDLEGLAVVMRNLGYVEVGTIWRHTIYTPRFKTVPKAFGEHADHPIKVEVHTAIAELLPVSRAEITNCLQPARPRPGLNPYPSMAALVLHLVLHAAGNMLRRTLRQIQLHDIAALAARLPARGWEAVLSDRDDEELWWAYPPLALAERYYPGTVPAELLADLRRSCPRVLRFATDHWTLTDVSWSNLKIQALPGLPWSRTPLEALRYVQSRALPTSAALSQLAVALADQPQLNQVRWYGVSHGERILRLLFSRPPRVQTLLSVTAALERPEP